MNNAIIIFNSSKKAKVVYYRHGVSWNGNRFAILLKEIMRQRVITKEDYKALDLLQAGLDHLKAAEILLRESPEVFDSAGYLAHLGIELMIKSWMIISIGSFNAIHSLKQLIKDMEKGNCKLSLTERELQTLAYIEKFKDLRYPSLISRNPVEIGSADIDQINQLADTIWQQMPDQLVTEYGEISHGKKAGRVFMKRLKSIVRDLKFETDISS